MRAAILLEDFGFVFSLWPRELSSNFAVLKFIMDNIPSLIFKFFLCLREEVYHSALKVTKWLNLALAFSLAGLTRRGWREEEDKPTSQAKL